MRAARIIEICLFAAGLASAQPVETPAPGPAKHVIVDKTHQQLRAYEGNHLVLECRISTGKWSRSTPTGHFQAGDKSRMHYSRLYHHAPMPYSVHVCGNVFIHGFSYVPAWPASHGCIRVPLDGNNPAKRFYAWVDPGTPIDIIGEWNGSPRKHR
jgi:lipoprotein-anchoring transpeptidase ErfK/SrfK